jgi:1-phosphatidylinositol-4-phosphate 5-kinase
MRKSEARVLLGMLPGYYAHVTAHPHTLITRFFGVHRITPAHGRAVSRRPGQRRRRRHCTG